MRRSPVAAIAALIAACAAGAAVPALLAGASAVVRAEPASLLPQTGLRSSRQSVSPPARPGNGATTTDSAFTMAAMRHYGPAADASGYAVIVATGLHQAWVLGGTNPGGPSAPVAMSWNGSARTTTALPPGLTSFISDASATSAADVWAASEYGRYVLHFDGASWRLARRWPHGEITGLTAVTPHDVWIFGTTANGTTGPGTWHFNGTSWRQMEGQAGSIMRASAVSSRDIWAVAVSPAAYSILRFDGTTWQQVPTGGALDHVQPRDILAISPHDVWVLGDKVTAHSGVRLVLMQWNGTRWSSLETRISAWAGRLAAGADGGVLVSATPASASASGVIVQASAGGGGIAVSSPSELTGGVSDVVLVGGHELWASGAVLTRLGGSAVVWTGQLPPCEDRLGT